MGHGFSSRDETGGQLVRSILVCGDRDWKDIAFIWEYLDALSPDVVIEGHARGADFIAHSWANRAGVKLECHPAKWKQHGKAAGPIRNREMLKSNPDLVLAFHDSIETSKGTADMLTIAADAGIDYALICHEI